MGNSNSQSLHQVQRPSAHHAQQPQWAHSYPRSDAQRPRSLQPQVKVLPERIPGQRLRVTDNGAILHNGGTISGRRQSPGRYSDEEQPHERYRARSSSAHRHQQYQPRPPGLQMSAKRFGSEPDLRHPTPYKDAASKQRITRTRKKYKAPAPPPEGESHGPDSSSPDSYQWETLDPPARRLRLFKTREETKKVQGPRGVPLRNASPENGRPTPKGERVGRDRERSSRDRDRNESRGRDQERIVLNVRDSDRVTPNGKDYKRPNGRDERIVLNVRDQERNLPNGKEHSRGVPNGKEHDRRERERNFVNERDSEKNVPNRRGVASEWDPREHARSRAEGARVLPDHGVRVKVEKRSIDNSPTIPRVNGVRHAPPLPASKSAHRSLSTPEFQAELLRAAQRIRQAPKMRDPREQRDPREPVPWDEREQRNPRESVPWDEREARDPAPWREARGVPVGEAADPRLRGDGSGRESTPEPVPVAVRSKPESRRTDVVKAQDSHWDILPPANQRPGERDVPTKTFYFGMEQGERDAVERFAESIHRVPAAPTTSGSGGSLTSDIEPEEDLDGSIALQLRPMLPKKQLEIPRFSPTAAWRLLSALETPAAPHVGDEPPVLLEERIQRLSRPMAPPLPPMLQAPRSSHDKSGDSGISGDASPGGHEDSSEAPLASPPIRQAMSPTLHPPRALVAAWTPQQDLGEEESSSDGGVDESLPNTGGPQPKFSPRAQVFSLSLPRDERLCLALYSESNKGKRDVQPSFNSLKKLKRSVSGAFTALNTPTKVKDEDKGHLLDENWMLSRSVANSLNSGHARTPVKATSQSSGGPSSPEHDPSQLTSFSYLATGGHVMYLPEYKSRHEPLPDRSYGALRANGLMSKSCENISSSEMRQLDRTPSPDLDCVGRLNGYPDADADSSKDFPSGKRGKNKRFTFQSTVRQIERKRISERLSREADLKERRRLGELEAMRRVEEEFQRKRAPEKANIRQQLRLFNLDETLFSSLPNGWSDSVRAEPWSEGARAEPDGATSSSTSPHAGSSPDPASAARPPSTQILSEFREPRRDYREYRPSRYAELGPESLPVEKRSTIHPPAVFDMPKSTQVYVAPQRPPLGSSALEVDRGGMSTPRSSSSDNYRRDFAHGAFRSLASSDSELSQPNTRPPSRQRSRSPSPVLGRRSKSAEPCSSSEEEPNGAADEPKISANARSRISLTSVQPFVLNGKGYRPIAFNLGTNPSQHVAQPVI